jgi:hypothetical protein
MVSESKLYIVEQVNSNGARDENQDKSQIPLGNKFDYERIWICE